MTKKTYFIRCYNWMQRLVALFFLILVLLLFFRLLNINLESDPTGFPLFYSLHDGVKQAGKLLARLIVIAPLCLLVLTLKEVIHRVRNDSLRNLGKSIVGTYRFRRLLKQSQPITFQPTPEHPRTENMAITQFNRAVGKSVLDIMEHQLRLFIKIPKEAQAQKILSEHEEQIKEHIASFYPDYIISTFERKKYSLWLIGTKRKGTGQ